MFILNDEVVEITRFPDNTFKFDINKFNIRSRNKLQWNFESMEELFILIGLADKLKSKTTSLFIPYLPNARMDKVQSQNEGFMLKYFIETVDNLMFDEVLLLDPHSDVYSEFTKKTNWFEIKDYLKAMILNVICEVEAMNDYKKVTLLYPDKGARARYTNLIGENTNLVGVKVRNQETGEIINFNLLGDIPEQGPILIIDDICSYGGTFYHTAKKLRQKGYKGNIYLYVTHAEESMLKGELVKDSSEISRIFTTDSLLRSTHEKVEKYNIKPEEKM